MDGYEKWWGSEAEYDLATDLEDFYEEKFNKSCVLWDSFDNSANGFTDDLESRPEIYSTGGYTSDYEGWGQDSVSEAVKNGCETADEVYDYITKGKKNG